MNDLDDINALAAEYVLGTLTAAERDGVTMLRVREPALDAAIAAWENRLGPMIALVPEVAPSAQLLDRIYAQIRPAGKVIDFKPREAALTRRAHGWRNAAIAMTALAASFAGVLGWRETVRTPMASTYVAVLQAGQSSPALLLTVDTAKQMFAVRALTKPSEQGKAYELWLLHDKLPQPKSLGVVPDGDMEVRPVDGSGIDRSMFMNATFAVSLEPAGGSPTGQPTGPVLFTGKLYQTTP
jgi:anti-sigma-K factor RskA